MRKKTILSLIACCIGLFSVLSASTSSSDISNAPSLQSAVQTGQRTEVKGTLQSRKNKVYIIQFFNNPANSPNTEGLLYIGEIKVKTNNQGKASFKTLLPATSYDPAFISATATRLHNSIKLDTSEFSQNVQVSS